MCILQEYKLIHCNWTEQNLSYHMLYHLKLLLNCFCLNQKPSKLRVSASGIIVCWLPTLQNQTRKRERWIYPKHKGKLDRKNIEQTINKNDRYAITTTKISRFIYILHYYMFQSPRTIIRQIHKYKNVIDYQYGSISVYIIVYCFL
jgi:hypothetical protein